tara:strand:- start:803 stop:1258 length:456 start_codon:yes stop_codon:yes gene_type:complete
METQPLEIMPKSQHELIYPQIKRPNQNPVFGNVQDNNIDELIMELVKRRKYIDRFTVEQMFNILNKEVFRPITPSPIYDRNRPPTPPKSWISPQDDLTRLNKTTEKMSISTTPPPIIKQHDTSYDYFGVSNSFNTTPPPLPYSTKNNTFLP